MFKRLTKNVAVTILKGRVYLHLEKYKPVVISAEDRFRKGIEVKICSRCKSFQVIRMWQKTKSYCNDCTLNILEKEGKKLNILEKEGKK